MPAGYLLDTNVISETRRLRADGRVMAFLSETRSEAKFLSVLTLGELRRGVTAKRRIDPVAADQVGAWVDGIEATFADRILGIDVAIAKRWGDLSAGKSLPVVDTLLAATAIARDLTLVTRNTRDVEGTGVPFIDPWQAL